MIAGANAMRSTGLFRFPFWGNVFEGATAALSSAELPKNSLFISLDRALAMSAKPEQCELLIGRECVPRGIACAVAQAYAGG